MDDMNRHIETATDLNVEGVEFYLGEVTSEVLGAPIYKDKELTELADINDLVHYYNMNDLILVGETSSGETFYSRVNDMTYKELEEGEIKSTYMLFYNEPTANLETGKIELVTKYSLFMIPNEVEEENNSEEVVDGNN